MRSIRCLSVRGKTADVAVDVPISIFEAALGCTVDIPTPSGKKLRLKVPAGTQTGKSFRFKEMGMPDVKRGGHMGALLATVTVQVPTRLTDQERGPREAARRRCARLPAQALMRVLRARAKMGIYNEMRMQDA